MQFPTNIYTLHGFMLLFISTALVKQVECCKYASLDASMAEEGVTEVSRGVCE